LKPFYDPCDDFSTDTGVPMIRSDGDILDIGVTGPVADGSSHCNHFLRIRNRHQKTVAVGNQFL